MTLLDFLPNLKPFFTVSAVATILLPSCESDKDQQKQEKPNIISIMSDDHTYQAIGAYGSRLEGLNPTPTIDSRLAEEGMMFTNVSCNISIQPFFLMHHYKAPHDMFEFAPRYSDYLEDTEIPEPASLPFARKGGPWGLSAKRWIVDLNNDGRKDIVMADCD